jgi:hypothetical protein
MRRIALFTAAIAIVAASSPAASETEGCSARAEIVNYLSSEIQEAPVAIGMTNDGRLLEILSSRAGGSWTMLVTLPNGISCPVAAGENWQDMPRTAQYGPEL